MSDHFSRVAVAYASFRPRYPDELFTTLAQLSPARLAARFELVIATDASAAQIRQAAGHPRVRYLVATAEAPGLAGASVDLITVAQALHRFDLDRFYSEVRRVLVPGGLLAVWTYAQLSVDGGPVDEALGAFYSQVVGPYWPEERRLVETGYRTLPFPFDEISVGSPPMLAWWTLSRTLGYVRTWSAVQRYVEARGSDPLPARRIAAHWGDPESPRRITWPLTVRAGRTRAKNQ